MVRLVLLSLVGSSCFEAAAAFHVRPAAFAAFGGHRALSARRGGSVGWAVRGGGIPARGFTMSSTAGLGEAMKVGEVAVVAAAVATRHVAASLSVGMEEGTLGKADFSPVTVGDFAVQAIVCKRISEVFPEDGIIAEETADELRKPEMADLLSRVTTAVQTVEPGATPEQVCDWIDRGALREHRPRYWTLDPIDGTKGFLRRQQYAICLGLIIEGIPMGVLFCAYKLGVMFSAYKGGGAWSTPMPPDPSGKAGSQGGGQRHTLASSKGSEALRFCEGVEPGHSDQRHTLVSGKKADGLRFCEGVEPGHSDQAYASREAGGLRFCEGMDPGHSDQASNAKIAADLQITAPPASNAKIAADLQITAPPASNAKIAADLQITAPPVRLDSQVKYGVMTRGDAEIYLRLPLKAKTQDSLSLNRQYVENIWDHATGRSSSSFLRIGLALSLNGVYVAAMLVAMVVMQDSLSLNGEYVENIWDHATGVILMQEAGGVVTDMKGVPLDFSHGPKLIKNRGVVASASKELHDKVIAAIAVHLP
ncbi:hypothetical protein T484DRAFT_1778687 [Baffinella frigidus]|nr:hypothetical protein T484DRAFT_1778687 [Cryptophyta sp. CCMP2293]